jgi:putative hydrolase of the HAD superfamily
MRQLESSRLEADVSVSVPEVLIFDLFGVIAHSQCPKGALLLQESAGAPAGEFWAAYWDRRPPYDRGEVTGAEYWASVGRRLGLSYDRTQTHELIAHDVSSWARVNDDMVALLEDLAATQRLALLSNIPHDIADHYLKCHKWLDLFEVRGFSNFIGSAKPELASYRWCLRELSIDPDQALFVDDRAENIRAALDLGMRGHLFTSPACLVQSLRS